MPIDREPLPSELEPNKPEPEEPEEEKMSIVVTGGILTKEQLEDIRVAFRKKYSTLIPGDLNVQLLR